MSISIKRQSTKRQSRGCSAVTQRMVVAREVLGLSETQVADALGVSLAKLRDYKFSVPNPSLMLRFGEIFDVSIDWLVSGEGAGIKPHLRKTQSKVAILPVQGKDHRRHLKAMAAEAVKRPAMNNNNQVIARATLEAAFTDALCCGDPVFAAIERCRRMIRCMDAAWAADPAGHNEDALDALASEVYEARVALAQCTPTTWAGLEALVTFVGEQSAADKFFYFEGEECKPYAASLGHAIQCLRKGGDQK